MKIHMKADESEILAKSDITFLDTVNLIILLLEKERRRDSVLNRYRDDGLG